MSKTIMNIYFYPVGNGDSALVIDDKGKHLLVDYNCSKDAKQDKDERIHLEKELNKRLKKNNLDVLMISHAHEDHYNGFSDYFWLNHSKKYQEDGRKKINELWVPDALIWETGIKAEGKILRAEARHRLLEEKKGIKIIGNSDSLKEFINDSGKVLYEKVSHLIFSPGEIINDFSGFDIFIHSPHSWKTEDDENKNNKCIVFQADFKINSSSVAKVIFGGDAESDAWESIYSASINNKNLQRLDFDVFKISHHCSYTALNSEEKGDLITKPLEKVKKIFEEHSLDKCKLIASCKKIPVKSKRNESGPPHYQAAQYYKKVCSDNNGDFEVTMQQSIGKNCRKPISIEISKYGAKLATSTAVVIDASENEKVIRNRTERFG